MRKDEVIAEIVNEMADVQCQAQGFMDWKPEPDLEDLARHFYAMARQASEEE